MTVRNNVSSATGTFNAVAAGSDVTGAAVFMGNISPKVKNLSAKLVLDVETDTLTVSAIWQVSNDNATWFDVASSPQNAAAVVLGTGTAGADPSFTKVIPAPDAIYGWQWARIAMRVGVTTGTVSDTYTVSYAYRQVIGANSGW